MLLLPGLRVAQARAWFRLGFRSGFGPGQHRGKGGSECRGPGVAAPWDAWGPGGHSPPASPPAPRTSHSYQHVLGSMYMDLENSRLLTSSAVGLLVWAAWILCMHSCAHTATDEKTRS